MYISPTQELKHMDSPLTRVQVLILRIVKCIYPRLGDYPAMRFVIMYKWICILYQIDRNIHIFVCL